MLQNSGNMKELGTLERNELTRSLVGTYMLQTRIQGKTKFMTFQNTPSEM